MLQPITPQALPPTDLNWSRLVPEIGRANRSLAAYGVMLEAIPNPAVLLSPLTTKEAVLSSKIEGTVATLGDVLEFEAGELPTDPARTEDIREVLNYRSALRAAEKELPRRPFSLSMLKALHGILMKGVRGDSKTPGQFRMTQNWIGPKGCSLEEASFIPPIPATLAEHLEAWESFYRSDQPDPLVQLAIVHAQFEIIHPFNDGNGRIGRILIPIFLFEKKILRRPMYYLSEWLEAHREDYIERLRALGTRPDAWNDWAAFFLQGIDEQAAKNTETARRILALKEHLQARIIELTHSQYAAPLLDQLFRLVVFERRQLDFGKRAPTGQAVYNLLNVLVENGILKVHRQGRGRRSTVYVFAELVNICEGREIV